VGLVGSEMCIRDRCRRWYGCTLEARKKRD
jgi:hypothetical protein